MSDSVTHLKFGKNGGGLSGQGAGAYPGRDGIMVNGKGLKAGTTLCQVCPFPGDRSSRFYTTPEVVESCRLPSGAIDMQQLCQMLQIAPNPKFPNYKSTAEYLQLNKDIPANQVIESWAITNPQWNPKDLRMPDGGRAKQFELNSDAAKHLSSVSHETGINTKVPAELMKNARQQQQTTVANQFKSPQKAPTKPRTIERLVPAKKNQPQSIQARQKHLAQYAGKRPQSLMARESRSKNVNLKLKRGFCRPKQVTESRNIKSDLSNMKNDPPIQSHKPLPPSLKSSVSKNRATNFQKSSPPQKPAALPKSNPQNSQRTNHSTFVKTATSSTPSNSEAQTTSKAVNASPKVRTTPKSSSAPTAPPKPVTRVSHTNRSEIPKAPTTASTKVGQPKRSSPPAGPIPSKSLEATRPPAHKSAGSTQAQKLPVPTSSQTASRNKVPSPPSSAAIKPHTKHTHSGLVKPQASPKQAPKPEMAKAMTPKPKVPLPPKAPLPSRPKPTLAATKASPQQSKSGSVKQNATPKQEPKSKPTGDQAPKPKPTPAPKAPPQPRPKPPAPPTPKPPAPPPPKPPPPPAPKPPPPPAPVAKK